MCSTPLLYSGEILSPHLNHVTLLGLQIKNLAHSDFSRTGYVVQANQHPISIFKVWSWRNSRAFCISEQRGYKLSLATLTPQHGESSQQYNKPIPEQGSI